MPCALQSERMVRKPGTVYQRGLDSGARTGVKGINRKPQPIKMNSIAALLLPNRAGLTAGHMVRMVHKPAFNIRLVPLITLAFLPPLSCCINASKGPVLSVDLLNKVSSPSSVSSLTVGSKWRGVVRCERCLNMLCEI